MTPYMKAKKDYTQQIKKRGYVVIKTTSLII